MDGTDHQLPHPIVDDAEPDADSLVRLPLEGEVLEPPAMGGGGVEEPGFSGAEMVREAASPADIGEAPVEDELTDVAEQAPAGDGREIEGLGGEAPVEGRVSEEDSGEGRVSGTVEAAPVEGFSDAPVALDLDSFEAQGSGFEDVNPASSPRPAMDAAIEQSEDVNPASSSPAAVDAAGEQFEDVNPASSPPPAVDATGEHLDDVNPASSPPLAMDAAVEKLEDVNPASSSPLAMDATTEHHDGVNPASSLPPVMDATVEHLDDVNMDTSFTPAVDATVEQLEDVIRVSPREDSIVAASSEAVAFVSVESVTLVSNLDMQPASSSHDVGAPADDDDGDMMSGDGDGLKEDAENVDQQAIDNDEADDGLKEDAENVDELVVDNDVADDELKEDAANADELAVDDEADDGLKEDAENVDELVVDNDVADDGLKEDAANAKELAVDNDEAENGLKEDAANADELAVDNDEADDELKEDAANADELAVDDEDDDTGVMMDAEDVVKEEDELAPSEAGSSASAKRKRGRPPKGQSPVQAKAKVHTKLATKKKDKEEEDVCFICFDGGELVLCDKRGCPKAYHPACVSRDEKFFQSKGKWTCGWHICNHCDKAAQYMCFTCTFSLCKGCQKQSVFLCVRGFRGFCEICMGTVLQIEFNQQENEEMAAVDFDDKNNWEYLFKEYWLTVKKRLSITSKELTKAKNSLKESVVTSHNEESSDELYDATKDPGIPSDSSAEHVEDIKPAKKKPKKRSRSASKDETSPSSTTAKLVNSGKKMLPENAQWASKELLEFVAHMRDGDTSVLSPFDVQPLLLEYIKRHKLRDPRRKSQIICDTRLKNLFGKVRVGHFEMLKLLELHFISKEEPSQGGESVGGMTDTGISQMDVDDDFNNSKDGSDKKRKKGKKAGGKGSRANLEEYAAIDVHNVNLIYLRRNLMEALLDDLENFESKVVGSLVRIRISGSGLKQDMYRLVQVVGTSKAVEPYKTGRKTTEITLEILNLNKTEIILIDTISNQDFSEEECKRLRQSIKCGFIRRLSVGEVLEKAKDLQTVRVNDWLETETSRLSHLRDRASEKGRRKELRECVEKLQLLATPEERTRRLKEMPDIHADPNMDPSHESDEENDEDPFDRKNVDRLRPRGSSYGRNRDRELAFQGSRKSTWESSGNVSSKGLLDRGDAISGSSDRTIESSWNQGRGTSSYNQRGNMSLKGSSDKGGDFISGSSDRTNESSWNQGRVSSNYNQQNNQVSNSNLDDASLKLEHEKPMLSPISSPAINESEKMWYYQDPSGKTQGPFSLIQLRKWNTNKYFPADLRIWKNSETQDDSLLLTDALIGKFYKDRNQWEPERTFSKGSSISDVKQNSELGWGGSHNPTQVGELQNVPNTQVMDQWTAASLHGQPQTVTVRSATSYQGRENVPADNAYRWNAGQSVGTGWTSGGSNGSNPTVQLGNDSSREWERPSSFGTPTPAQNPPNPGTAGWTSFTGNIPTNPNMSTGAPQSTGPLVDPNQIISPWVQQPVSIPQGVTDAFNPPTPTPKQTSGVWDNLPNPSNNILQPSSTMENEPGRLTSNWTQVPQNQGGTASTLPRSDQVGYSSNPTVEPRQQHPGDNLLSPQAIMNQVNFAGQRTASSESGWPSQNSTQPLGSGFPAGVFPGMSGAVNSNWSPTVATAKPSRWGPALPSSQDQNVSSTPSSNWSAPPTPTPNSTGGATVISGSNTAGGWGTNQHSDVNPMLGGNDNSLPANGGWNSSTQSNSGWGQADNNGNWGQGNPSSGRPGNNNGNWDSAPMESANAGWGAAAGNSSSGSRGYRQNYNDDRYSSRGDRYSSGDYGYRNNRQQHWNRSNSGGGRGYQNRGICKYFESGRCVKGANCDYPHS